MGTTETAAIEFEDSFTVICQPLAGSFRGNIEEGLTMLRYLVSIDGAPAAERFVMLHSLRVAPGTLCEISIDGHMQLYVVERVATLILSVRRQHPVPLLLGPHAA